jgi:hypothetical protein
MNHILSAFCRTSLTAAMLAILFAPAAQAEATDGLAPMSEAELASAYGGFILPDGMNINIGIEDQISVNGVPVSVSQLATGPLTTIKALPSVSAQIQNVNGLVSILQLAAGGTTVISNSASNLSIDQLRTITIDVANFSKLNPQAASNFAILQSQALNGLRNGVH